jgi:hypothetical protein
MNRWPLSLKPPTAINPADPAAGANLSYTSNAHHYLELLWISLQFTTSAAAIDRYITFLFKDSLGNNLMRTIESSAQGAGISRDYFWSSSNYVTPMPTSYGDINVLPPSIFLPPVSSIDTNIVNLQAGDQLAAITLWARIWLLL